MDAQIETELNKIISEKKLRINEDTKKKINKIDFIEKTFYKNYDVLKEYVKEKNISIIEAYDELKHILEDLLNWTPIHLECKRGFQLKKANEFLYVRLGYYKIKENPTTRDLEEYVERCSLEITQKGRRIGKEYKKVSGN